MYNVRTLKIALFVIALHLLVLYAVQSGLAHRVVATIAPSEIVALLIAPEVSRPEARPQLPRPAQPRQQPQATPSPPRPQSPAPQPAPSPVSPEPTPTPARETSPVNSNPPAQQSSEATALGAPSAAPAAPAVSTTPAEPRRVSMTQIQCVQVEPRYPQMSRRLGEEGTTVVRLTIGESGKVEKVELTSSSGSPRLDQAALEAARTYKCQPYVENGQARRAYAVQPFSFTLD